MKQQPKALFAATQHAFTDLTEQITQLHQDLEHTPDIEECVDVGYALRETKKLIESLKTQLGKAERRCNHRIGALWQADPSGGEVIRTPYCSGTIEIKQTLSPPTLKKDPDQYAAFMVGYLGIDHQIAIDYEVVRPHFPGMVEFITAKSAAGLPVPEGIDPNRISSFINVVFRRKKGITE